MHVTVDDVLIVYSTNKFSGFNDHVIIEDLKTMLQLAVISRSSSPYGPRDDFIISENECWSDLSALLGQLSNISGEVYSSAFETCMGIESSWRDLSYEAKQYLLDLEYTQTPDEFIKCCEEIRIMEISKCETQKARKHSIKKRRQEFDKVRHDLVLKLIDSGRPYRCAMPECEKVENLTIDHIKPLSRGGTDDLTNLQFMCRPHNSQKSNAVVPEMTDV